MKPSPAFLKSSLAVCLALFAPAFVRAQHYTQNNLVSDGAVATPITDNHLVNPWGLVRTPGSPWWVADNGTGLSTLYNATGVAQALIVTIPPPAGASGPSAPTGIVWNGTTSFGLTPGTPATNAPLFMFVTEDGTISGWNKTVSATNAVIKVDNSKNPKASDGAVYKGCTIGEADGVDYLYVTNFRAGRVEVYDTNYKRVHFETDGRDHDWDHDGDRDHDRDRDRDRDDRPFDDDRIPRGYAPFNIQSVGTTLIVTYAKQDNQRHDDVAGEGFGYVDVFSTKGKLLARLEHGSWMNSPWGVALAPGEFGEFSHSLLIGNFGSGQIAAFDPFTGHFLGLMKDPTDKVISINGLWAIAFGNAATAGPYNTLYFTAGFNNEADGLFGTLTTVAAEQNGDEQ